MQRPQPFEGDYSHLAERGVRFIDAEQTLGVVGVAMTSVSVEATPSRRPMPRPVAGHPEADPRTRETHVQPRYTGVIYDSTTY